MDRNSPIEIPTTRQSSLPMMSSLPRGGEIFFRFAREAVVTACGTEVIRLYTVGKRSRSIMRIRLHAADRIARTAGPGPAMTTVAARPVRAAAETHHGKERRAPEQQPTETFETLD